MFMDKRKTVLLVGVDKWKRTPSKSTKATSIEPGLPGETDNQFRTNTNNRTTHLANFSVRVFWIITFPGYSLQMRPSHPEEVLQHTSRRIMVNLEP
jgi:hypothetical protein